MQQRIFSKITMEPIFLGNIVALDQMHQMRPFAAGHLPLFSGSVRKN
jgi:hypothetical protein